MSTQKFPPVADLSPKGLQRALKAAMRRNSDRLDPAKFANHTHRSAPAVDLLLRQAAGLGYVEWVELRDERAGAPHWRVAELGRRLLANDLGPRISLIDVDRIIAELLASVRALNVAPEPEAFFVTELRLYGSALDRTAGSYGDVDVDMTLAPVEGGNGLTSYSQSAIDSFLRRRERFRKPLEKSIPKLSLTVDETSDLEGPIVTIYRFDPMCGVELPLGAPVKA